MQTWQPHHLINGYLDNRTPGKVTGWLSFERHHQRWRDRIFTVALDLEGDLHEDLRGTRVWLIPDDYSGEDTGGANCTLEGLSAVQRGLVGDLTGGLSLGFWTEDVSCAVAALHELRWGKLGLSEHERAARRRKLLAEHDRLIAAKEPFYPAGRVPYLEFYSQDGRVVLTPEPEAIHVHVFGKKLIRRRHSKTPTELFADEERRAAAFRDFIFGGAVDREVSCDGRRGDASAVTS
jgi:hypothetical protein